MHLKKRSKYSHKGQNGIVTVIGGSREYTGAVYLAAEAVASMRLGIDLVYVLCPEKVAWTINKLSPDLITVKLKGEHLDLKHYNIIKKYIDKSDVILLGNGISKQNRTKKLVNKIIKNYKLKKKIVDADALKMIKIQSVDNAILTPHHGEFDALLKNSKLNKSNYRKYLRNNVILLKGHEDYIISKNKVMIIKGGNPGMTVGGTGDVLAGLCAGYAFLTDLFNAAVMASKLNKKIGDKLKKELGNGLIASDFLKEISKSKDLNITMC